ncbi:MAG: DUF6512 family protein [Acidobacteriota bacterium]|nr:DUF6512 family protein [Acidobacteriota bacterium]
MNLTEHPRIVNIRAELNHFVKLLVSVGFSLTMVIGRRTQFKALSLSWELFGILFIGLTGGLLHFVFDLMGGWQPVALIAPVNESTWEHFKMAFWPGLFVALIEIYIVQKSTTNLWLARSLGLFSTPVTISVFFYGYMAIVGRHYLMADILIFWIAVVIGRMVSYKLSSVPDQGRFANRCGAVLLVLMMLAFSLFTYYPPQIFLFEDPQTQQYGILQITD